VTIELGLLGELLTTFGTVVMFQLSVNISGVAIEIGCCGKLLVANGTF
jgi:hypothetical protein